MTMIYAIHAPMADHLAGVIAQMRVLGAPTIHVVDCGDYYQALEGSHRLAAAAELGLVPNLTIIEQDQVIDISGFDWFDTANWAETAYTGGEVAGELFAPSSAVAYSF